MVRQDTSSMSRKRSRSTYETDPTSSTEAPFVFAGTAVPSSDASAEYGLSKKHAAPDRTRLHGAFTGGWSAGYFNTVGSKEGWTPSHFTSSRSNRHKDGPSQAMKSLPQDYMDEEDLADTKDNQRIDIAGTFGAEGQGDATDRLQSLMQMRNETMGVLLLKQMGWKVGQGVGAKIWRKPRGDQTKHAENRFLRPSGTQTETDSYSFAPEDIAQLSLSKYTGRVGVGFRQSSPQGQTARTGNSPKELGRGREVRSGFGARSLNESSSDEDVSQGLGPKLRYTAKDVRKRMPGKAVSSLPGGIRAKGNGNFIRPNETPVGRKNCLPGFLVGVSDSVCSMGRFEQLDISSIPPSWAPLQQGSALWASVGLKSSITGAARHPGAGPIASTGLPMTSETRRAMFASSGDSQFSLAQGQPNVDYALIPHPSKKVAEAALARDRQGRGPYRPDTPKRTRYQQYLEHYATLSPSVPPRPPDMSVADFTQELSEFERCARIFGPMAASMASRFTTATSPSTTTSTPECRPDQLSSSPARDTATEAAVSDMFGALTRSTFFFNPAPLLCKRFNVRPPAMDKCDNDAKPDTVPTHTPMPTPAFLQPVATEEDKPTIGTQIRPPGQVFSLIFGGDSDDETA